MNPTRTDGIPRSDIELRREGAAYKTWTGKTAAARFTKLQGAIDALQSGDVLAVGPASYTCTAAIAIPAGVTIINHRSVFTHAAAYKDTNFFTATSVSGWRFIGDSTFQGAAYPNNTGTETAIRIDSCGDWEVVGVHGENVSGWLADVSYTDGTIVQGGYIGKTWASNAQETGGSNGVGNGILLRDNAKNIIVEDFKQKGGYIGLKVLTGFLTVNNLQIFNAQTGVLIDGSTGTAVGYLGPITLSGGSITRCGVATMKFLTVTEAGDGYIRSVFVDGFAFNSGTGQVGLVFDGSSGVELSRCDIECTISVANAVSSKHNYISRSRVHIDAMASNGLKLWGASASSVTDADRSSIKWINCIENGVPFVPPTKKFDTSGGSYRNIYTPASSTISLAAGDEVIIDCSSSSQTLHTINGGYIGQTIFITKTGNGALTVSEAGNCALQAATFFMGGASTARTLGLSATWDGTAWRENFRRAGATPLRNLSAGGSTTDPATTAGDVELVPYPDSTYLAMAGSGNQVLFVINATAANTASTIVARDASNNFSAGTITATLSGTATNFSGSLVGDVGGTQGATAIGSGKVTNTMLAGSIADSKLSTISTTGKVANSATTGVATATADKLALRDGSGDCAFHALTCVSITVTGGYSTMLVTGNTYLATAGGVVGLGAAAAIAGAPTKSVTMGGEFYQGNAADDGAIGTVRRVPYSVASSSATPVTISHTLDNSDDSSRTGAHSLLVHAVAVNSDGSEYAAYVRHVLAHDASGTASILGSATAISTIESTGTMDLTFTASGGAVLITCTGKTATDLVWKVLVEDLCCGLGGSS